MVPSDESQGRSRVGEGNLFPVADPSCDTRGPGLEDCGQPADCQTYRTALSTISAALCWQNRSPARSWLVDRNLAMRATARAQAAHAAGGQVHRCRCTPPPSRRHVPGAPWRVGLWLADGVVGDDLDDRPSAMSNCRGCGRLQPAAGPPFHSSRRWRPTSRTCKRSTARIGPQDETSVRRGDDAENLTAGRQPEVTAHVRQVRTIRYRPGCG
jgi:hypothetical protein